MIFDLIRGLKFLNSIILDEKGIQYNYGLPPLNISIYERTGKRRKGRLSTSSAIPGHQIGRSDSLDRASYGYFIKKLSIFCEIHP